MVSYILFNMFVCLFVCLVFFSINFYPFLLHFWPSLPCTSQWGKFSSSKFCISDFRIKIYTKFQSGKHIILYILANYFFFDTKLSTKPRSGGILNPVVSVTVRHDSDINLGLRKVKMSVLKKVKEKSLLVNHLLKQQKQSISKNFTVAFLLVQGDMSWYKNPFLFYL